MNTPFFEQQPQEIGSFNIFDTSNIDDPSIKYKPDESLWSSFGDQFSKAGDYVWDSVNGVWSSAKELGAELKQGASDLYTGIKWEIIFWLGAALLVIWIVARSGILVQASKFLI